MLDCIEGALGNTVVGGNGSLVALGRLVGIGKGRQGKRRARFQIEGELKVDRTRADAAFASQRLAQVVESLRQPGGRARDKQLRALAGFDLGLQGPRDRMSIALDPLEVRLEQAQRQLGIAAAGGVPRIGEGDAQRALVVLGDLFVGGAGFGAASGLVGQQRAMVAQVVLRPVRLLRRLEN
jgi:hypothetical protein